MPGVEEDPAAAVAGFDMVAMVSLLDMVSSRICVKKEG